MKSKNVIMFVVLVIFVCFVSVAWAGAGVSLVSPADGAILSYNNPTFSWKATGGVDCNLSIDDSIVSSGMGPAISNFTSSPLSEGSHNWYVTCVKENKEEIYVSETRTFTINTAISGCTDSLANNYNSAATEDDNSCTYDVTCTPGGTEDLTYCWDSAVETSRTCSLNGHAWETNTNICAEKILGCMDLTANNYNPEANSNEGCTYTITCSQDSDCGTNGLTDTPFCDADNLLQNHITYTCNNPSTATSFCSDATTQNKLDTCIYGCTAGSCNSPLTCLNDCSAHGTCDLFTGTCSCNEGWEGSDCGSSVCDINTGQACNKSNVCGVNTGVYLCDGNCDATEPLIPANYEEKCNSAANSCGDTNEGTIQCDGSCSAVTPDERDCVAPKVVSVTSSNEDGLYRKGQSINVEVKFSEPVTVTPYYWFTCGMWYGSGCSDHYAYPQLTIQLDGQTKTLDYTEGSGTDTLIFKYSIADGEHADELNYVSADSLIYNGESPSSITIADDSGNAANIALPEVSSLDSLAGNKDLSVDGDLRATVLSVYSDAEDGLYSIGSTIPISVKFSEPVTVSPYVWWTCGWWRCSGNYYEYPKLTLSLSGSSKNIAYSSGSGTDTLIFNYVVESGDDSLDLDYLDSLSLLYNSKDNNQVTITDAYGTAANLALASPSEENSLGYSKDLVIDGKAPTATVEYSTTELTSGEVVATITPSEDVTITNNDGLSYTFTNNGEFTFEFVDAAGNTGSVTASVSNIDTVAPTAEIDYSITDWTNSEVVATITPSEDVTITNNDGLSYTFTNNGEFTFEFVDASGNTGSVTASVSNIDKTSPATSVLLTNEDESEYVDGTWTDQDVWISLSCDDGLTLARVDSGNSGCGQIYYEINLQEESSIYDGEFQISAPGYYVINYWSEDNAGNYGEKKQASVMVTAPSSVGGSFQFPEGSTPESADNVTVFEDFTVLISVDGGNSSVFLPAGTVITKADGSKLNLTQLSASNISLDILSALGENVVVDGALQWGIPSLGLQFSKPITIKIFLGSAYEGKTLDVRRSVTGNSDWTQDGIDGSLTCVVTSGICEFKATKASYYATTSTTTTTTGGSGGGEGHGGRTIPAKTTPVSTPAVAVVQNPTPVKPVTNNIVAEPVSTSSENIDNDVINSNSLGEEESSGDGITGALVADTDSNSNWFSNNKSAIGKSAIILMSIVIVGLGVTVGIRKFRK